MPGAGIPPRVQAPPQFRIVRQESQLRAVARFRQLRPILDLAKIIHFLDSPEQRLILRLVQFRNAQKVRPPLHHRHFQVGGKVFLQKRNVLLEELLLQRFCRGRNHYTPAAANRGNQVRQGLARSSARFHNGVMMRCECVVHQLRHLQLRGAVFVIRTHHRAVKSALHAFFEESARAENFLHRSLCVCGPALGGRAGRCGLSVSLSRIVLDGRIPPLHGFHRLVCVFSRRFPARIVVFPYQEFHLARAGGDAGAATIAYPSLALAPLPHREMLWMV